MQPKFKYVEKFPYNTPKPNFINTLAISEVFATV